MSKREKQRAIARINRLKKHGFNDEEINKLASEINEIEIRALLIRLKKQGRLG